MPKGNSVVCGPIESKFELIKDLIVDLDTCKHDKNDEINSNLEKEKTLIS